MKAAILAGGLGTHLSEETHLKLKPKLGGKPVLLKSITNPCRLHQVQAAVNCSRELESMITLLSEANRSTATVRSIYGVGGEYAWPKSLINLSP